MNRNLIQPNLSKGLSKRESFNEYNTWIYENLKPFLGKRILDIGSGVGTFINYFVHDSELIIGTDIFENQVNIMKEKFKQNKNIRTEVFSINEDSTDKYLLDKVDTITCINVLEHIKDDNLALQNMKDMLIPGGKIVLLVPAFNNLYGTLDEACGHWRRYDKNQLSSLAKSLNLKIIHHKYMNAVGIIPWYIKGKILRNKYTFSESLNVHNTKLYNFAAKFLKQLERVFEPTFGISEIIVLEKSNEKE
jgi:2-polyprenyl-3-methyl-5-hydroxy-6-metoxy-1,4-benzoquinol methylase